MGADACVALRGVLPGLSLLSTAATPLPTCCPVSLALLSWLFHFLCLPSSCVCSCTVARSGIYPHLTSLSVPRPRLSFCPKAEQCGRSAKNGRVRLDTERLNGDLSQSNAESASLPDLDLSSSWRNDNGWVCLTRCRLAARPQHGNGSRALKDRGAVVVVGEGPHQWFHITQEASSVAMHQPPVTYALHSTSEKA